VTEHSRSRQACSILHRCKPLGQSLHIDPIDSPEPPPEGPPTPLPNPWNPPWKPPGTPQRTSDPLSRRALMHVKKIGALSARTMMAKMVVKRDHAPERSARMSNMAEKAVKLRNCGMSVCARTGITGKHRRDEEVRSTYATRARRFRRAKHVSAWLNAQDWVGGTHHKGEVVPEPKRPRGSHHRQPRSEAQKLDRILRAESLLEGHCTDLCWEGLRLRREIWIERR
jgi:hypothetical protein